MPIRVLRFNLLHGFEHLNPKFRDLAKKVNKELGLDFEIEYTVEEEAAKSPYVIFNKILVQEPFLSYVWCMCFSLTVLHTEITVKMSKNAHYGIEAEVPDMEKAREAYKLWEYAVSLISGYSEWGINTPNPENVDAKYTDLIQRVNSLYLTAMTFVLAHEFAHVELEHNAKPSQTQGENAALEREADARAIQLVMEGVTEENKHTRHMGLLMGLCSLLFFKSSTKEASYPNIDDRIQAILDIVKPNGQDPMWDIASLSYKLWGRLYQKNLIWQEGLNSPQHLYESIKRQIQAMNGESK
jgi:hypothetical protein